MRSTTRMRLEHCTAASSGQVRFCIRTRDGSRISTLGRVVEVAPHLTATFVAHRAVSPDIGWCISDSASGYLVGHGLTEAEAVSMATANLALCTGPDLHRARAQRAATAGSS